MLAWEVLLINPSRRNARVEIRTVVLYGGNLVMSSLGAALQKNPEFQVRHLQGASTEIVTRLEADPPDVILFDIAAAEPNFAVSLLWKYPAITVIGVDLTKGTMLLLSGSHSRLLTMENLVQVIKKGGAKVANDDRGKEKLTTASNLKYQ